jgi:hypothetical protein
MITAGQLPEVKQVKPLKCRLTQCSLNVPQMSAECSIRRVPIPQSFRRLARNQCLLRLLNGLSLCVWSSVRLRRL